MLPDGVTQTKGFVKDPDEAQRYKSLDEGDDQSQKLGTNMDLDQPEKLLEDRKRTDLTKNVGVLTRFIISKVFLFRHCF